MASQTYPLGKRGPIIGTPYEGTHTLGNWQSDNAIDIKVPVGTPVYAVANGVIGPQIGPQANKDPRFAGDRLTLVFGSNAAFYGHLSSLAVKAGEHVVAGQLLGYSGEGNGVAHLHFAVEKGTPGDVIRGAAVSASAPTTRADQTGSSSGVVAPGSSIGSPSTGTPPGEQPASVEMPGTAQHYLPGSGTVADSWQALAALPDLSPDTQRLITLSSGG